MKPIIEMHELHQVEMWLIQLKCMLEAEALEQPPDMRKVYEQQAKEVQHYLDQRLDS